MQRPGKRQSFKPRALLPELPKLQHGTMGMRCERTEGDELGSESDQVVCIDTDAVGL